MTVAETHHVGHELHALTFGKRGAPAYARLYRKSVQADREALIRTAWERAGYEEQEHGLVWRIELEVRSELLRTLSTDRGHLPRDPFELLAFHLDELWEYLLTQWLVLHATCDRSRIERSPAATWWAALATTRGLNGELFGPQRRLARRPRPVLDPTPLLRQTAGLLAAIAAMNGASGGLDETLAAVRRYIHETKGHAGFSAAVRRARERQAVAAIADGGLPVASSDAGAAAGREPAAAQLGAMA